MVKLTVSDGHIRGRQQAVKMARGWQQPQQLLSAIIAIAFVLILRELYLIRSHVSKLSSIGPHAHEKDSVALPATSIATLKASSISEIRQSTSKFGAKPLYKEPSRDASWVLNGNDQATLQPLTNEGQLSQELLDLTRNGRGVLFNAIHKDPLAPRASKPIAEVARSIKRMVQALEESGSASTMRYAVFTERAPWEFMNDQVRCRSLWPECAEFAADRKYISDVRFYDDLHVPAVIARREKFQTWPELWLKRIIASLNSPYAETLVVDSDVYACSNFEHLFDDYLSDADIAITLAPAPFGSSRNYNGAFRAGFPPSYANYTERNLGLQVLATGRPHVLRLLALFRDVYIRHVNDTARVSIGNDQASFREAVFTMRNTVRERTIPESVGCRHNAGCPDGCLVVHRHHKPELSGKDYNAWKKAENEKRKQQQAARKTS
eukprot:TRINITY_DN12537_c0_g3_i1.p1 TRINITY_DN12537_c0_g3~~TRINITY_DN12537_c0_g3_i1.p1  ORF type:complete len:436 (+),score=48.05 TRINITY_DN12537_c0_g3_i1:439-1746(+)